MAEFTSDVPLARVLLARDVIDDAVTATDGMHKVQGTDCVEDLLAHLSTHSDGVAVIENGAVKGVVTPTSVVRALSRGASDTGEAAPAQEAAG